MNALAQLVYDLDLGEGLVLTRLKREGLIPYDCWDSVVNENQG